MRKLKLFSLAFIFILFIIPLILSDTLPIFVRPVENGNLVFGKVYIYNFSFSTSSTCSDSIFSHYESIQTNRETGDAFINVSVPSNFISETNFVCVYRDENLIETLPYATMFFNNVYAKNMTISNCIYNKSGACFTLNDLNTTSSTNYTDITFSTYNSTWDETADIVSLGIALANNITSVNNTNNIQVLLAGTNISQFAFNQTLQTFNAYNSTWDNRYLIADVSTALSNNITSVNNTANINNLFGFSSSYFMPNNKSVIGTFDFNQGWTNGGLTIENGNIFAQTGYFYNISSLSVSTISTNGSLLPSINNTFDIGNQTWLWRDAWFGRTLRSYALSYFFGGIQTTNVTNSNGDLISVPQGMVSFFARESCPKGWTQDSRATGRYIVGTDNSPVGEVNDTVGTALTDNENRPAGNHTHDITDPQHTHGITDSFRDSRGSSSRTRTS